MSQLWPVSRAARYLGISPKTVYRLIRAGRMRSVRVSERSIRVFAQELEEILKTRTVEAWDDARMEREMEAAWQSRPRRRS